LGTGISASARSVALNWNASTSTVNGYFVYRGTRTGGPYTKVTPTFVAQTGYQDAGVGAGQTYFYVVTSVDSSNVESIFSNEVQISIP
jgi:fibronectin type 3 domain-containing protein